MTSKLRSDAWESALPEETRRELYRLSLPRAEDDPADRPYLRDFDRDVRPYLSLAGIVAPSRAGWYRFLGRMREEAAAERVISVETSKRIAEGIVSADIDPRLAAEMMTALSVDAAAQSNNEASKILADAAAKYYAIAQNREKLELDRRSQETKDAQLKLAREKFEAAERRENAARNALGDTKLTDAAKIAKMKEIFG